MKLRLSNFGKLITPGSGDKSIFSDKVFAPHKCKSPQCPCIACLSYRARVGEFNQSLANNPVCCRTKLSKNFPKAVQWFPPVAIKCTICKKTEIRLSKSGYSEYFVLKKTHMIRFHHVRRSVTGSDLVI